MFGFILRSERIYCWIDTSKDEIVLTFQYLLLTRYSIYPLSKRNKFI